MLPCWFDGSLRSPQKVPFLSLKVVLTANPPLPVARNERTSIMTLNFQDEVKIFQRGQEKSAVTVRSG